MPHTRKQTPAKASIDAIATYLPEGVLTNETLAQAFPDWPSEKILSKTGIRERRIAAPGETATDLAFGAASRIFNSGLVAREDIDFVILCTQAPDFILPTSACLLQARLNLRSDIGAFDINLGCSGFVYGLSIATGLLATGAASKVLLLTADTYSKYIHEGDKSVRTLFGDGAAAAVISASSEGIIGPFAFGTDGRGAGDLIVEAGGFRTPVSSETGVVIDDGAGNLRSRDNLFMNGGSVMAFTLREVPRTYRHLLEIAETTSEAVDFVVLHQANKFMLDALQKKLGITDAKMPRRYEDIGNTVSSTIPFVLETMMAEGRLPQGTRTVLLGFGVGLSWAGAQVIW